MAAQSLIWLEAVCLCICLVLADAFESPNVQRLSASRRHRSRSIPTPMSVSEVEAPKTVVASFASQLKGSKNNPETDWKNDVAGLAKKSQSNEHFTDLELDFMSGGLVKTPNSFQWLVDLYDPLRWTKLPGRLNPECARQMGEFIDALWKGEPWAAKMSDASGRYSSQWHFGNGHWLGSNTLCRELNRTALVRSFEGFNDTSVRYSRSLNDTVELSLRTNDTGSMIDLNVTESARKSRGVSNDKVPFRVQFYVSRFFVRLPADIDDSDRQIFIGQCLPSTCDLKSVESMMRASAERVQREGKGTHPAEGPVFELVHVRPVPSSDYKPKEDPRFYALTLASGLALILMILCTIYEYRTGAYDDGTSSFGKRKRHSTDCESSFSNSNNNRGAEFDKNLEEHRRIAPLTEHQMLEKTGLGVKQKRQRRSILLSCLLAFSPRANGSKIISTEPASENSLTCLHGMRVISLAWVIMVHTYLQVFSIAENKTLRTVTERNFLFQTISNATFSVDTFFCISGLLVTILFYRSIGAASNDKGSPGGSYTKKFAIMVLYRFIRLTPSYLFVLGLELVSMKYSMSTTVFSPHIIDHLTCEKYWWRNVLYVNSLYPRSEMCMLWSWYMANDMQFYILGMILLLLSIHNFQASVLGVGALMVGSWLTTFSVAYVNDYRATIQEPFALFDELYDKPWLRAGPYFIGMMAGYLLYKTNCNIKIPRVASIGGWVISAMTMCLLVYGLYPEKLSVTVSSLYASLGHTAWACAIAFIVIQCCCGAAPIVDKLLSLRIMYPLSRLTYCAYLVHPMIMMITSTRMDGALHLHNGMVLTIFFGNCVISYLVAFFISLAFEAPVVNLLKLALSPKKRMR